jgi:hypothetical protein
VLISWEGCTLEDPRLELLAKKLVPPGGPPDEANYGPLPKPKPRKWYDDLFFSEWFTRPDPAEAVSRGPLFKHVDTGQRLLDRLTEPPISLTETDALDRLRGLFIGPDDRQTCAVVTLTEEGKRDLRVTLPSFTTSVRRNSDFRRRGSRWGAPRSTTWRSAWRVKRPC